MNTEPRRPASDDYHTRTWTVRLDLFEEGDVTRVHAVLDTGDNRLQASAASMRDPVDRPVPEIGDEFAAGRALLDLGYQLLRAGNTDSAGNGVDVPS
ncbi:dsRBD fold-containing protein [Streptacidiphilus rugosus]|uniref:dsRBD fold-containing protein n=1 Tax=Streptacidiphilus rugosus TaxID=405783 RepID=UPI00068DE231|nr:dsRBD fold-containing protein [Streptacidiphilus rugosus]